MPALKEISSFKVSLADSQLAKSPLWNMQAHAIIPAQLSAFKARLGLEGFKGTSALFVKIVAALEQAKRSGEIENAPILRYSEPKPFVMTSRVLREGFERMTRPLPAAILFALETGLEPDELTALTWTKAKALVKTGKIKTYARLILESQPRHITSKCVFWKQDVKGTAQPLYELELEVFEQFKMVWSELQRAYSVMILNDDL